jgi:hypothetical protein
LVCQQHCRGSAFLAVLLILSKVSCSLIRVNRLHAAVIIANVHHFQRSVKS